MTYGIPTNNETMAFIWNADIFKRAGLDPDKAPATWDDVVKYSKQIHDKLGIAGYGLVARKNAGNTPYRFMPQLWAYGGGVFDEADPNPTYGKVELEQRRRARRRCRPRTTCMSATSRCRSRRSPTSRPTTSRCSSPASSA